MSATIRAIVFKTPEFKATLHFFKNVLQVPVKEISARHFVIHSKSIRLVFIAVERDFEIEWYMAGKAPAAMQPDLQAADFKSYTDPNGISIKILDGILPDGLF